MVAPTTEQFLALFPEFSDQTKFPTPTLTAWLGVSANFVNESRWGDSWSFGVCLFAAHELSLARQAAVAAAAGGVPGGSVGLVASKSVGPLSKSYDNSVSKYDDAGFWNLSVYGQQYWGLVRIFGAGGSQLGIPPAAVGYDVIGAPPGFTQGGG